jgi:hypothetical protein
VLSRAAYLVRAVLLREPIDERFDLGLRSLAIGHNTFSWGSSSAKPTSISRVFQYEFLCNSY